MSENSQDKFVQIPEKDGWKIHFLADDTSLYCKYQNQNSRQPVELTVNLEQQEISIGYSGHIGSSQSWSFREWNHLDHVWDVPFLLDPQQANMLMSEVREVLIVSDLAFETTWDGSNWVGQYNSDEMNVLVSMIEKLIQSWESCGFEYWDPQDFFGESDIDQLRRDVLEAGSLKNFIEICDTHDCRVDPDEAYEFLQDFLGWVMVSPYYGESFVTDTLDEMEEAIEEVSKDFGWDVDLYWRDDTLVDENLNGGEVVARRWVDFNNVTHA